MTDKQIIKLSNTVLSLSIELSGKLQELARIASERLGYDVVADLCNGAEIEFRRIEDDGVANSDSCIRLEDILAHKAKKTEAKDDKCCVCGKQAVAYYSCVDPDIPSYPYCAEHLEEAMIDTAKAIWKNDKRMQAAAIYQAKQTVKRYRL